MDIQLKRQGCLNVKLSGKALDKGITQATLSESFLHTAIEKFHLSACSYHKVWRIARTLADLDAEQNIAEPHFLEALNFRSVNWGADKL
jgi:magnesium chelatase family protein